MKVLQLLPSLEVGGVERGVIDLVRAMKRREEGVVVISSGGPLVAELQKIGVPHYALPVNRKSLLSLSLVPKIAEIIRREGIDIVHARSRVPGWLGWFAARQTGVPFVTTCHGYYSVHFLSRVMGWGKRVIVISRVIGRHMIDDFKVSPDKIRLVHRGVDLSHFQEPLENGKPSRGEPLKPFRIINIGRLSPIKGQVEFLKAVHLLHRDIKNLEVCLVGSEERGKYKYTSLIEKTIDQLDLRSCVKLLGTRRDIPELLRGSDLLVLSTLVPEAFGRVIVEAGAVGIPVVATRIGGILDIINDGEDGLLVMPGDIQGMAEAMRRIYQDGLQAQEFSKRLKAKVYGHFSLDRMVDGTLAVYREVREEKKILAIKLGALGDLILITPSLRMIRERFPGARISLMVDKKWASLISNCPYLDDVIPVERGRLSNVSYLLKLAKKIREEGFDDSVDFQNSKWTHLLAALGGIPRRFGFSRGLFGFLINRPDWSHGVTEPPVKNQFRILSKLGIRKLDERLELWTDAESEQRVENWFQQYGAPNGAKRVGLCVGSSPQWMTKRWPLASFGQLAERLVREFQCQVFWIASPEEAFAVEGLLNGSPEGMVNLAGKTSLRDLVSLIKRMDVIVTGDTAPLHIAGAVDAKIVALFGPTDPRRHMPPSSSARILHQSLDCQPCYQGICPIEDKLACLKNISVGEVLEAVKKQFAVFPREPKNQKAAKS